MKSWITALILLCCTACSKKGEEPAYIDFEAHAYKTNIPVGFALIRLLYCAEPGIGGCGRTAVFATYTTDAEGRARVATSAYRGDPEIAHDRYFTRAALRDAITYMDPAIAVNARLLPRRSFPAGARLQISVTGEQSLPYEVLYLDTLPAGDTVMPFKAIAGQVNRFSWRVYAALVGASPVLAEGSLQPLTVPVTGNSEVTFLIQ